MPGQEGMPTPRFRLSLVLIHGSEEGPPATPDGPTAAFLSQDNLPSGLAATWPDSKSKCLKCFLTQLLSSAVSSNPWLLSCLGPLHLVQCLAPPPHPTSHEREG
ncbi:hypothetical protein P7K49_024722 [Saguinus oedipus]|uniref:Uncharacterized protein n=1 Tax=Saguinus oedipus TaxID=9490 RepID=A0ABQ9UQA7_SAGOE|nr:hypothetical protein P7K49_024722 [Saguinus oedipus]